MICPCFTAMSSTLGVVTLCVVSCFQAQALRPEWPRQRRADPHLKQLLSSSVNILAVALGLANGSECMD